MITGPPPTNSSNLQKTYIYTTRDKWHLTSDIWHWTHDTWHVRGNSIENGQYFSIWRHGHKGDVRGLKKVQVVSECIIYPPGKYQTTWLGLKFPIISKSTSFLLRCLISDTSQIQVVRLSISVVKELKWKYIYICIPLSPAGKACNSIWSWVK